MMYIFFSFYKGHSYLYIMSFVERDNEMGAAKNMKTQNHFSEESGRNS